MMIFIKVYENMNLTMLILNMALNFMFVFNPKKLQV
jgi:hypothetical protein